MLGTWVLLSLALADGGAAPQPVSKQALTPEVATLVTRMQAFYEKMDDFTSQFDQTYTYKSFKRIQKSSGQVLFKKPALMRWNYAKPSPRTFILAGDKVYAYDPEALTLTKASVDTHQLSASVTFLWGKGKLADEFNITKGACPGCAGVLLVMDPLKPDPRFQQVRLEVDPKTAQVLKSTVVDPDGSENDITFVGLKTNVGGMTEDTFKLRPPDGTQVIDMTKPKQ
jgi:outer membrane lipoprotein carrier protein